MQAALSEDPEGIAVGEAVERASQVFFDAQAASEKRRAFQAADAARQRAKRNR